MWVFKCKSCANWLTKWRMFHIPYTVSQGRWLKTNAADSKQDFVCSSVVWNAGDICLVRVSSHIWNQVPEIQLIFENYSRKIKQKVRIC